MHQKEMWILPGENKFKLKTVFQNEKTYLILSLKKKEIVNESLMQSIEQPNYSEFLNAAWTKAGGKNKLTFDISNLVSLSEYIKAQMTQEKYFQIVSQIQKIYEKCSKSSMPVSNLVCTLENTYYDPKTSNLFMVYAPVANSSYTSNIVKFLYRLHNKTSVIISDGNKMNKYKEYLETRIFLQKKNKDKNSSFSYNDLYNFLHNNESPEVPEQVFTIEEKKGSAQNDQDRYFTPVRKSDTGSSNSKEVSEPVKKPKKEQIISKTVKANSRAKRSAPERSVPFLEDSSGVNHPLLSFPFSIGRSPDADLVINDPSISSSHAFIEEKNGEYYIRDNNSTNGTYINENIISSEKLTDGCKFSIYDTEFIFRTGRSEDENISDYMQTQSPITKTYAVINRKNHCDYIAYIQNTSTQKNSFISKIPCTLPGFPGIEITGSERSPAIKNTDCEDLSIETEKLETGSEFSLYSGCSFSIGENKYIFYMKN